MNLLRFAIEYRSAEGRHGEEVFVTPSTLIVTSRPASA
jgi:hypothetical protein